MVLRKLVLDYQEVFQGDFKIGPLNLLLVFQVNCPGCFLYAFPVAIELKKILKDSSLKPLNLLALATAFEDFEFNNPQNVRLLLTKGELVGETKKALNQMNHDKLPYSIDFPIAFDRLRLIESLDLDREVEQFCQTIEGYSQVDANQKANIQKQVHQYFAHKKFSAYTFDHNYLKGTPSWILFDHKMNILYEAFGHQDIEELQSKLKPYLS